MSAVTTWLGGTAVSAVTTWLGGTAVSAVADAVSAVSTWSYPSSCAVSAVSIWSDAVSAAAEGGTRLAEASELSRDDDTSPTFLQGSAVILTGDSYLLTSGLVGGLAPIQIFFWPFCLWCAFIYASDDPFLLSAKQQTRCPATVRFLLAITTELLFLVPPQQTSSRMSGETDGPHRIHPSILKVLANTQASVQLAPSTRQSFKSLDRSLKAFLRASNLPGLEYRLRIAGYNGLSDLLDADVETLCAHGFTPLMAHRLLGALDEYLVRQLDQSEGLPIPFQMVRKGQKINSTPTDKMKALPTFGKRNVKRQRQPDPPKMAKRRVGPSKGAKVIGQNRPVAYLRLMSEDSLPNEPIFPNVLPQAPGEDEEVWDSNEDEGTASPGDGEAPVTSGGSGMDQELPPQVTSDPTSDPTSEGRPGLEGRAFADTYRHSVPVFQEFSFPDEVDVGQFWLSSEEMGQRLNRRNSVPADYRFHGNYVAAVQPWQLLTRSYSSPSSLANPPSQIESTLNKLCTSQELAVIELSLEWLCSSTRVSEEARGEVREKDGLEVIVDLLASLCTNPRIVERCFKIIKYLAREGE